ncbi:MULTISPECIES: transporter substrate-binding domain-containing protein [Rhodoplanes]|uniref:transporter substrate-binding domain-containing protein n=1 Tax=Rhodoplanes TaxID=29407 RepID=UPI00351F91BB
MPQKTTRNSSWLRLSARKRDVWRALIAAALVSCIVGGPGGPLAPAPAQAQTASPGLPIPGFWDPKRRPERPDLRLTLIRFMSEVDYPPFNYAGADGNPAGFNVDLARAICDELKIACTMQMRRFDTLVESLAENRGDAAIASMAVSAETRKKVDFSDPYYRPVARFAARRGAGLDTLLPERVEGKKIAVVAGTAHEAYLKALFTEAELKPYPTPEEARAALQKGEVDLLFGDGYALAFWLNGSEAAGCCSFVGGPFVESRYFGEGVGIAVKKGNDQLRLAMNWALFRLWEKGKFADLWLKYFPVNPF